MKKTVLILIFISFVCSGLFAQESVSGKSTATPAADSEETVDKAVVTLTNPGKPAQLSASLLNGSITVSGYNGKEVIVEAINRGKVLQDNDFIGNSVDIALDAVADTFGGKSHERENRKNKEEIKKDRKGMKRIGGGGGIGLSVSEQNNQVEVEIESLWASVDLNIKVPFNTSVKLNAVNGGKIVVSSISGNHELEHVNGKILMNDISGSVLANTTNGDIIVTFKQLDPKAEMSFTTFNGDVDVTFPSDLRANIKLSSDRGSVYTDFEVSGRSMAKKKVEDRRSEGGRYEVSFDKAIYGTINGGGQEMTFKTFNGDILLRKNK